jgi:3-dehydroquinate dehydratase II
MMKILIINGPNLDMLHLRNKSIYGGSSLDQLNENLRSEFPEIRFEFFQSASEEEIVSRIHRSIDNEDGIIINPGAYSHTSIAIRDAIELSQLPVIEVHLSNLSDRERFRNVMITASKCRGYISGFKEFSYQIAVYSLIKLLQK